MGCVNRIFVWTMIVFLPMFTITIGLSFVADGLSGRDTLATGPVGTFTPTDKTCGRGGCALEGTFTSDDGTVTRQEVDLRDAMHVGSGDPLPPPSTRCAWTSGPADQSPTQLTTHGRGPW
jgi:hypothetical protein